MGVQGVNVALHAARMVGVSSTDIARRVGGYSCYASSGLGAAHTPVVIVKERQLTKEDTFRTALNGIREEQGRLTQENDILSAEIDDLQSEVDRMNDIVDRMNGQPRGAIGTPLGYFRGTETCKEPSLTHT